MERGARLGAPAGMGDPLLDLLDALVPWLGSDSSDGKHQTRSNDGV